MDEVQAVILVLFQFSAQVSIKATFFGKPLTSSLGRKYAAPVRKRQEIKHVGGRLTSLLVLMVSSSVLVLVMHYGGGKQ